MIFAMLFYQIMMLRLEFVKYLHDVSEPVGRHQQDGGLHCEHTDAVQYELVLGDLDVSGFVLLRVLLRQLQPEHSFSHYALGQENYIRALLQARESKMET